MNYNTVHFMLKVIYIVFNIHEEYYAKHCHFSVHLMNKHHITF